LYIHIQCFCTPLIGTAAYWLSSRIILPFHSASAAERDNSSSVRLSVSRSVRRTQSGIVPKSLTQR